MDRMSTYGFIKRALGMALGAAAGAALAKAQLLTFSAPLGAMLTAAISPNFGISVIIGTAAGGLVFRSPHAVSAALAGAAGLVARFRTSGMPRKNADFIVSAFTSAAYIICAAAASIFSGRGAFELLRLLIYSALLMAGTYQLARIAAEVNSAGRLSAGQTLFVCALAVCGLSGIEMFGATLGGAAAAYFVMLASARFGARDAVMTAAVCAVAAGACEPELFTAYALFCVPAIVCGSVGFASPIKTSAVFLLTYSPIALLLGSADALALLLSSCAAAAVFAVSCGYAVKFAERLIYSDALEPHGGSTLPLRGAIGDITEKLHECEVCGRSFISPLSDAVYAKVCMSCCKNDECFDENSACSALTELDSLPRQIELGDICRALPNCQKIAEVRAVSVLARRREDYASRRTAENRGTVRLCSMMLGAVEKTLADAEKNALRAASADEFLTARLSQRLRAAGVKFIACAAYPLGGAEVRFAASARVNEARLTALVSMALGKDCPPPEHILCGETVILRYAKSPEYKVLTGFCQLSADKDFSGDVAETFTTGGHSYTVLSDGMGIGEAARAAALTLVRTLRELLCAGFSAEASVALGSMILGSALPEESFATLDILKVDLSTGAAEIYKAGGCKSYILCDGCESVIREGGYPIGILEDCGLSVQRFNVNERATVVMLTDGAAEISDDDISRAAKSGADVSPAELAACILRAAHPEKSPQKDDVSVAVVKVIRELP